MMVQDSRDSDDKVAHFQAVTGLQDSSLCAQILEAYGWDLDRAVTAIADGEIQDHPFFEADIGEGSARDRTQFSPVTDANLDRSGSNIAGPSGLMDSDGRQSADSHLLDGNHSHATLQSQQGPGLVWRVVTLPISVIRGSYNMMYGTVNLGMWIAGGVLSHSLGVLGWGAQRNGEGGTRQRDEGATPLLPLSSGAAEAFAFVRNFEREYGDHHPAFQATSFMDALRRAREEFKFLFVYLHSAEHENTPLFCERTLCSDLVVSLINENFVAWGGNVRASEGFRMSNSLKASTFPFCAVVMASTNQRVALLQQFEGPKSSADLVSALRKVVEEQGAALVAARIEEEERQLNRRLREEQDVAYQAALQADRERDHRRREEAERIAFAAAEAERKLKEEAAAAARAAQEVAEREAAIEQRRQAKAMALGSEPEKGPNVTEVLIRFPNGERREHRFLCTATISSVYDYVDSLHGFNATSYKLVSNFPRVVYGLDKFGISLKDAGLHPRASLYIQIEDA